MAKSPCVYGAGICSFDALSLDAWKKTLYFKKADRKQGRGDGFSAEEFYAASLSCKTILYKGMFVAPQLEMFYPDLLDTDFVSALVLVHQDTAQTHFPHGLSPSRFGTWRTTEKSTPLKAI